MSRPEEIKDRAERYGSSGINFDVYGDIPVQVGLDFSAKSFTCKFCDFVTQSPVATAKHEMKHRKAVKVVERLVEKLK